jgi:phosphopantetheinyl transferase
MKTSCETTLSKTNKSAEKEKRAWDELLSEKKRYIERLDEDEQAKRALRDFLLQKKLEEMYPDDPPF